MRARSVARADYPASSSSQIARGKGGAANASLQAVPQAIARDLLEQRAGKALSDAGGASNCADASAVSEMDPQTEAGSELSNA